MLASYRVRTRGTLAMTLSLLANEVGVLFAMVFSDLR